MDTLTTLCVYWMLFFIYCVAGYIIECTYCRIVSGEWTNRGFLNGPYLPIWGTGAMMGALLFKGVTNPLIIFFGGGAVCCALEWVTSYTMEKLYHARWWDYSDLPLNFQGRFWIGGFVEFGLGLCAVALLVNPPLEAWLRGLPFTTLATATGITSVTMATDLVITHIGVSKMRDKMDQLVAETRDKAYELREQALETKLKHQEAAEEMRAQAQQAAEEMRAQAIQTVEAHQEKAKQHQQEMREQLAKPESWAKALEWHMGEHLRTAQEKARAHKPNLPQLPALDEVADKFRSGLTNQERRILNAFPEMRPSGYKDLAQELADAFDEDEE